MVSVQELSSRVRDFYRFSSSELLGLIVATLMSGFIISFRDWGDENVNLGIGIIHLSLAVLASGLAFFVKVSFQKIYALSQGYQAEFKVWWVGIAISLLITIISNGVVPFIIMGAVASTFMTRQRLGEMRYGYSYFQNGIIALHGIIGLLLLALFAGIIVYLFPGIYLLEKIVIASLAMSLFSLLPLPQLEGLTLFFGSRPIYYVSIVIVITIGILILTSTRGGLIISSLAALLAIGFVLLTRSEK